MADSVTGIPVFTLADLKVASTGPNTVGTVIDNDDLTITTAGTNASAVSQTVAATGIATSGAATGITVTITVGVSGECTSAVVSGEGFTAADTVTVSAINGDAMDTNTVLTVDAVTGVVRDKWNGVAVVAVSDHPADGGDGNERAVFVSKSLNNVWRLGKATQGSFDGNEDGPNIVIPE